MNLTKKQLLAKIAQKEKILQHHQASYYRHQAYLKAKFDEYKNILLILAIPAFILGWMGGKNVKLGSMLQGIINVSYLAFFSMAKKKVLSYLI